jgi:hypothetical protein
MGGYAYNRHLADFTELPGCKCSLGTYKTGNGDGSQFGLLAAWKANDRLSFETAITVGNSSGTPIKRYELVYFEQPGDITGNAEVEGRLDASLLSIGIEPVVQYRIVGNLSLAAGFRAGFMVNKTHSLEYTIISPVDIVFTASGKKTELISDGDLPDALKFNGAVLGGFRYAIPLGGANSWTLEPEAIVMYQFTNVVSGRDWKVLSFRAGLRVLFDFGESDWKWE